MCRHPVVSGNLGRVPTEGAKKGVAGRHDLVASALVTSTGTAIAAVTSEGRAFIFHAGEAADAGGRTRGNAAAQQLGLNKGEDALALVGAGEEHLVLVTARGVAKQVTADEVLATKSGKPVIGLKDGDRVVAAFRRLPGSM